MTALKEKFEHMSDDELDAFLRELYADEANRFDTTVDELFDMPALREWFRAGFPRKTEGMSKGVIRLAMISLIEKGYLD